jgi:hypothetical protein
MAPKAKDKQPVGFATHIIAGGTAGMAEAVRVMSLSLPLGGIYSQRSYVASH